MNSPSQNQAVLRQTFPAQLLADLQALLGDRVATSLAVREHHGKDESSFAPALPDAVVFPHATDEVAEIVKRCAVHGVPLIAYGAGSSLEGHLLAIHGGVSVDMSHMNEVVALHAEDMDVTVQAGITRKTLNEYLRDTGLFFPIDPGADASIGGMTATRASGTNAVRYGTMKENVLALTVVLADGRIIHTGRRTRKSSAGYDLTRLFVGSEGTLGIITEITVRLYPQPEAVSAAMCAFPSVEAAAKAVIETIQLGIPVARVELLDALSLHAINRHSKLALQEVPTLFFEFHGSPAGVKEHAEAVQAIAGEHGGMDFEWATDADQRARLWTARHNAYFACLQLRPGCRSVSTDVCVPISRLSECIAETQRDIERASMPVPMLGHVGDGNFHLLILVDPDSPAEQQEAEAINRRLVERAIAMDGTCTGEHGIGIGKMEFMREEHGAAVDVMRSVKRALDPHNLLNPGKMIPP